MKRTMSFLGVAGCMLAAGSLYAASVTNTFDEAVGGWNGDCARSTSESNYVFSAADVSGFPTGKVYPLSGNYVLTVEGVATNAVSAGDTPLVDMMVQAARPDEELELPDEDAGSAQIAVAVDSDGYFNAYCKTNDSNAGWVKISDTQFAEDAWVRVSLLFDYTVTPKRCQIRLNGEPVMSQYGFLKASDTTTGGAWYNLATGSGASSVKVVGCTAIDEYVLNDAGGYPLVAGATNSVGVSCAWLDQYGLAWDTTTAGQHYDSSTKADGSTPMTVADKYKYCFSPFDGQGEADFAIKSMGMTASSVTVGVPEIVATAGRKVVLESATNANFSEGKQETPVNANTTTVVIDRVPEPGKVLYFHLRATDDNVNN